MKLFQDVSDRPGLQICLNIRLAPNRERLFSFGTLDAFHLSLICFADLKREPSEDFPNNFSFNIECMADPVDKAIRILRSTDVLCF